MKKLALFHNFVQTRQCKSKTPDPFFARFRGRPRGFNVDFRSSCFEVACCHTSPPNGAPRMTQRRMASTSVSVCTRFTNLTQSLGQGNGPASSNPDPESCVACHRLDQRHCSADAARLARSAFRSTYRHTL